MDWKKEEERWKKFIEDQKIEVGDLKAIVTFNSFLALDDYSCTLPSGTVHGKVWKRHEPYRGRGKWWFGQFTLSAEPDMIDIVWRELWVKNPHVEGEVEIATDDYIDSIKAAKVMA